MAVTVCAPLAVGGVHRTSLLWIAAAQAVGLIAVTVAAGRRGDGIRMGPSVVLPVALLIVPLLQSIPLPQLLHRALDPAGVALTKGSVVPLPIRTPLSLDPPASRAQIAIAAAALTTFLVAYHLAAGQRRRQWFVRAVGLTGVAALVIGISHRMFGYTKIYGLVPSTIRTLIVGPFVNANHTAELLELAAFACLACVYQTRTALNRLGWSIAAALCFAGTVATLSRGAVLALGAGLLAFLVFTYLGRENATGRSRRAAFVWTGSLGGMVALLAAALGADRLIARFYSASTTQDIRFQLWRDGLRALWAHPLGIGRGAFDRVYPVYRTLKTALTERFAFVEDEPLQLLIDSGWVLFGLLVAATVFVIWRIYRKGRRDRIEAAMLAGLVSVLAHNLVDFGLETPGVLLPFMAILGSALGRVEGAPPLLPARVRAGVVGCAFFGLILGGGAIAHASYDNFDKLIKQSPAADVKRGLLVRAQQAHPVDYFYVLQYALVQPLKPAPGETASPRLHALNHALELCPTCGTVHETIAQNLWQLSFRRQALLEWRSAIQHQPLLFEGVLAQLLRNGGGPTQVIAVAAFDIPHLLDAVEFLRRAARPADALAVLNAADQMGASPAATLVRRAKLLLVLGKTEDAGSTLARVHQLGIQTTEVALLDAQVIQRAKGAEGAGEALAILDRAAARDPGDVDVQRTRLQFIVAYGKWSEVERALEGYRDALYRAQGSAYEAHLASAQVHSQLSHWRQAIEDYRMALADAPQDVHLWVALGHAAELAGRITVARDAYMQAARLAPQDEGVAQALRALDSARQPQFKFDAVDHPSANTEP